MPAAEHHRIFRANWLRAAVLGANDGMVSTASLIIGVAAAQASDQVILTSGMAALVAGALSMAAGEYVSVHSQADIEAADLRIEQRALRVNSAQELEELTGIYVERDVAPEIARAVAEQLTRHNALDAHARDELGISIYNRAKPVQAALASAGAFASGAALPLAVAMAASAGLVIPAVSVASILGLGVLGAIAARAGGRPSGGPRYE
ncbi:VIT family protein [Bordetella holmesii 35009]|nr:VIT family protein [Bordetella holmesii 35009]